MIKLKRPAKPKSLLSPETRRAIRQAGSVAIRWAERDQKLATSQETFEPDQGIIDALDVIMALLRLSQRKCSFCETPVNDASPALVSRFRPPGAAVGHDGKSSLAHYVWLAYDWSNLFASCAFCDRAKGTRFPVAHDRAAPGTRGTGLADETPWLLDPCLDDPDAHLVFTADGRVAGDTERGRVTIDCFDLNRADLQLGRKAAISDAEALWRRGEQDKALAADYAFAAARRQAVRRLVEQAAQQQRDIASTPTVVEDASHVVVGGLRLKKRSVTQEQNAVGVESAAAAVQSSYSLNDPDADPVYFATAKYLERIEIHNWKPVQHAELVMPPGRSDRAGWLCLLGENGAGKSSMLQGVALALIGQAARDALELDAGSFVRHGANRATIRVWLSGLPDPVVLNAQRGQPRFTGTEAPKVLVLGYGATRLLPKRGSTAAGSATDIADVDNLFDPFTPMTDVNEWLLARRPAQFAAAARGLRGLLGLAAHDGFQRVGRPRQVRCRTLGASVSIDQLSDGYQSVVAVATDIMAVLLNRWDDLSAAEGIVVLDELGAHLHPRWRMLIVQRLRALFPRVQFLVTTHDPLCLRGLDDGEVLVVRRLNDEHHTVDVCTDVPPITGMRADQLLTSELFGLNSTVDPDVEEVFSRYYKLLAVRRPSAAQRRELADLEARLDSLRLLGDTVRERLVYQAADRWLAERARRPASSERSGPLHDEAIGTLAAVWADRDADGAPDVTAGA